MGTFTREKIATVLGSIVAISILGGCSGGNNETGIIIEKRAVLSGAQENPSVTTQAAGTGVFQFNDLTGAVTGTVTTFGLTGTAAHIHEGAVGVNGAVIVPLTQTGTSGVWTVPTGSFLSGPQLESLRSGNLYMNVHSAANPGGDIRAQIGRQVWYATLRGAQEVPAVTTSASGTGTFIYDPDTRTLSGSVTTTGLTGSAAHIHTGAIGVAGPVIIPMTGGPTLTLPATVLSADQATELLAGRLYANVHTTANPGGEIRGQLYQPTKNAVMAGSNEVPAVTTTSTGSCWVTVNPTTMGVAGRIETSIQAGSAAHLHRGAPGAAGPVVVPMTSPSAGVWVIAAGATLTDELLARFMEGALYCNLHTTTNPGGEIRGTLVNVL